MVKDAEVNAEADTKNVVKEVDLRNEADSLQYSKLKKL